ncbi:MAG: hypothetical protein ACF8LL_09865, partial [Phycisphaerales bacterium]
MRRRPTSTFRSRVPDRFTTGNDAPPAIPPHLFLGTTLVFIIGFLSLLGAYLPESPLSSEAWRHAFGSRGWLIETGRLVIGLGLSLLLIVGVYWEEFCLLIGLIPAHHHRLERAWLRGTMIGFALLGLVFLLIHHMHWGPQALAMETTGHTLERPELWASPSLGMYVRPYLTYLPYSFITMIVIFFGITWLGFFGAWIDFTSASAIRAEFAEVLSRSSPASDSSSQEVLDALYRLSWSIT